MSSVCLENVFQKINKAINIDSERKEYVEQFDKLKNYLFKILKENSAFKSLFSGFLLAGSYGDCLKITAPDEFDQIFHLKLPESNLIIVTADASFPGNVLLDLTKSMQKIQKEKQHACVYALLSQWVTADNILIVDKLQSWLQSLFTTATNELKKKYMEENNPISIQYKRCGPAHTLCVSGKCSFSVDFVPGIILDGKQSLLKKKIVDWEAIPKPLKPLKKNCTSFQCSYYKEEKKIICNKMNFKNTLRIMKKFRDNNPNLSNLKSYFIKTTFLWKASTSSDNYWQRPLSVICMEMFLELERLLVEENIPFFWNKNSNLLKPLNSKQIHEILMCVRNASNVLLKASQGLNCDLEMKIYKIFLSRNERLRLGIDEKVALVSNDATNNCSVG